MKAVFMITQKTKAIIAEQSAYYRTKILEGQTKRYSIQKAEQILDNNCIMYGSTLVGRKKAVKRILNMSSKLPIPVIPNKGVYMFPTTSTKNLDCVWVSYYHVDYYEQRDSRTYIAFIDGTGLYIKVSISTFDLQYKRTSQVIAHLNRPGF